MEIKFPVEFVVSGTPVSHQAKNSKSKEEWKQRVSQRAKEAVGEPFFASDSRLCVSLFYFPPAVMQGDVDNIVKLTLDALSRCVYVDDQQIERIVVQKFEPERIYAFESPSPTLASAMSMTKPVLFISVGDDPHGELQ